MFWLFLFPIMYIYSNFRIQLLPNQFIIYQTKAFLSIYFFVAPSFCARTLYILFYFAVILYLIVLHLSLEGKCNIKELCA